MVARYPMTESEFCFMSNYLAASTLIRLRPQFNQYFKFMTIKFHNNHEIRQFCSKVLFVGNKDFTYSDFNNIRINTNFYEVEVETDLDEYEVAAALTAKKIRFMWISIF